MQEDHPCSIARLDVLSVRANLLLAPTPRRSAYVIHRIAASRNELACVDKTALAEPTTFGAGRGRPDRRRALGPHRCQEEPVSEFAMYAAVFVLCAGMIWAGWYFGGKLGAET